MAQEKRGRGRPEFEPTDKDRATVKSMAGYGIPQDEIAAVLDIAPKTLRHHFRRELDTAMTIANAKVVESLYQQAVGGNVTAAIWWTKGRMGWKEKTDHEHTHKRDVTALTDAELEAIAAGGGRGTAAEEGVPAGSDTVH